MLQWMGGSRRKVTTSRRSIQKRQKQYFEQRKRQQQQQMAAFEGYDETSIVRQHQKECRSLDILSLMNLSTVSEEGKSCPFRRDDSLTMEYHIPKAAPPICSNPVPPPRSVEINEAGRDDALLMEYHIPKDPPQIFSNPVRAPRSVEIEEIGVPKSRYQGELHYPNDDNHSLHGMNNNLDLLNAGTEKQLSVFDMLDDASEGYSAKSLVHEAHVAFSIEGLGKIEAETPPHSPKQYGRISSDDCSLPQNVARLRNMSKTSNNVLNDLEIEVDAMIRDIILPLDGNLLESSMGPTDGHGSWKSNLSTVTDYVQLESHHSNRKCCFGDTGISYNLRRRQDMWDAKPSFLDDEFLNEGKGDVWKCWPHKDGDFGDLLEYEKDETLSNAFQGKMLKKGNVNVTKANMSEPPSPMHTKSEIIHDYTTSIGERHAPTGRNYDIRKFPGQPDWPYSETEKPTDNLSWLSFDSEESSSSSAVRPRGDTINSSPPCSVSKWNGRKSNSFDRGRKKHDMDNLFDKDRYCEDRFNIGQRLGKCMKTPVDPKPTNSVSACFRESIGATSQTWVLEEGCNSVDEDLSFTSEAKLPSLGSNQWAEDCFGAFPVPELNFNDKYCFDRPKHSECSPFGSFTSEKFAFDKLFNHTNWYDDSPVISKVGSGSEKQHLQPDSRIQVVPHGETGFTDLSVRGSLLKEDKRQLKFWHPNCKQFELGNEPGNELILADGPTTMDGLHPKNKDLDSKESKAGILEAKGNPKATYSPEQGEEASSSVKIRDKSESSTNEKGSI